MYEEQIVKANVANKCFEISEIIKERLGLASNQNLICTNLDIHCASLNIVEKYILPICLWISGEDMLVNYYLLFYNVYL